jgi:hypothetical protein
MALLKNIIPTLEVNDRDPERDISTLFFSVNIGDTEKTSSGGWKVITSVSPRRRVKGKHSKWQE